MDFSFFSYFSNILSEANINILGLYKASGIIIIKL